MSRRIAIIGVGSTACRALTPDVSYRELVYEAAVKAYEDAGVDPRKDIQSFVTAAEDCIEGISITDCYTPDQLGAALRPVQTVTADGIHGLITAYMQILTGALDVAAVAVFSKASNMLTPEDCLLFAFDPILNRPLNFNPYCIAGMEMNRYLHDTGTTKEQCALVTVKNKGNALDNPNAAHGARISVEHVLNSETNFYPLSRLDVSPPADGAIIMVLASEEAAKALSQKPVWIRGVGWASDTFSLETRDWDGASYATLAADMAYKMAGITQPRREIDLVEIDDTFSYKELQHLESLRLCRRGEAGFLVESGATGKDGEIPVNLSGGSLGIGHLGEAMGMQRALEVVLQLRGEAGKRQVANATTGLAHSWRGIPTTSGAVIVLSTEEQRRHR